MPIAPPPQFMDCRLQWAEMLGSTQLTNMYLDEAEMRITREDTSAIDQLLHCKDAVALDDQYA
jgi:hypothetical protein